MRLHILHRTVYRYPRPAALGPHQVRLRPANHARALIESYGLHVSGDPAVHWLQDPFGNHVAHVSFRKGQLHEALELCVELAADVRPVNPFDFHVEDRYKAAPFTYAEDLRQELGPFLQAPPGGDGLQGPGLRGVLAELPARRETVEEIVDLNHRVHRALRYVIREEPGIWDPEETLAHGRGSCRDFTVVLLAALRARGFAARFVSGYLVQLTDEGMIPDEPRGVSRDVVDLHAWAEVFLPGAGWIGLDATSGLLCGEGHIPLACTARPALATPVEGTSDTPAREVTFEMKVARLGHEPRTTAPFTDEAWAAMIEAGDRADAGLRAQGLRLTLGGEPTFTSREHPLDPAWNGEALGKTKWAQGLRLARELRESLYPGAALVVGQGKQCAGEPLPRWSIEVIGRTHGRPLWPDTPAREAGRPGIADAARLAEELARRLGLPQLALPAFEDPWPALRVEAALPVEAGEGRPDLDDPSERGQLARTLGRGLTAPVGYVLPLAREAGRWRSDAWRFRRERLYLLPGDSPIGLRLPLSSIAGEPTAIEAPELPLAGPPDPRRRPDPAAARPPRAAVRTALCVEPRGGALQVFLPPLATAADFEELVAAVDEARRALGVEAGLEGYPPPPGPELVRIGVTPDPGVVEVNLPPTEGTRDHVQLVEGVYAAALRAGLTAEKYLHDGRMAGSGGGHHLTLGGPTPAESPFLLRPDLLASLITFLQHHPSMSYLFTGLFIGPTCQAPRADEARHDALHELEIALARAFDRTAPVAPWLGDLLFRHLLVDVTGNTHRAEISIDKLFDWRTPGGRRGLVELRAFEMPPHPRMASAQMTLVRALIAAFAAEPYRGRLVRWGAALQDRFLLPTWLWRDFEDVLEWLGGRGLPLPRDAYRAFLELRCPVVGRVQLGDVQVEVRNALEPWHVLGEEATATGTSRFVDSSVERIEVRTEGLVEDRHVVLVNGYGLTLHPTGVRGERAAGVRFRAWAPPHSLHAHLGIHHPIRIDVVDTWTRRAIGACAYHVVHPEGLAYDAAPLTRFEASARRASRFRLETPALWPVAPLPASLDPDMPFTLDLRRLPGDRPPPPPEEEE